MNEKNDSDLIPPEEERSPKENPPQNSLVKNAPNADLVDEDGEENSKLLPKTGEEKSEKTSESDDFDFGGEITFVSIMSSTSIVTFVTVTGFVAVADIIVNCVYRTVTDFFVFRIVSDGIYVGASVVLITTLLFLIYESSSKSILNCLKITVNSNVKISVSNYISIAYLIVLFLCFFLEILSMAFYYNNINQISAGALYYLIWAKFGCLIIIFIFVIFQLRDSNL